MSVILSPFLCYPDSFCRVARDLRRPNVATSRRAILDFSIEEHYAAPALAKAARANIKGLASNPPAACAQGVCECATAALDYFVWHENDLSRLILNADSSGVAIEFLSSKQSLVHTPMCANATIPHRD